MERSVFSLLKILTTKIEGLWTNPVENRTPIITLPLPPKTYPHKLWSKLDGYKILASIYFALSNKKKLAHGIDRLGAPRRNYNFECYSLCKGKIS